MTNKVQDPPFLISFWRQGILEIGDFDSNCTDDMAARRALRTLICALRAPITIATLAFGDGDSANVNANALRAVLKRLGFNSLAPEKNHEYNQVVLFWRLQRCKRILVPKKLLSRFGDWKWAFSDAEMVSNASTSTFCCGFDIGIDHSEPVAPITLCTSLEGEALHKVPWRRLGRCNGICYYAIRRSDFEAQARDE